jgi:hypothetical protein
MILVAMRREEEIKKGRRHWLAGWERGDRTLAGAH